MKKIRKQENDVRKMKPQTPKMKPRNSIKKQSIIVGLKKQQKHAWWWNWRRNQDLPDADLQQVFIHDEPARRNHLQVLFNQEPVGGGAGGHHHLVERHGNVDDEGDDEGERDPDGGDVVAVQVAVLAGVADGDEAVNAEAYHDVDAGGDEGVADGDLKKGRGVEAVVVGEKMTLLSFFKHPFSPFFLPFLFLSLLFFTYSFTFLSILFSLHLHALFFLHFPPHKLLFPSHLSYALFSMFFLPLPLFNTY